MYSTQVYLYQQKHEVLLVDLAELISDIRWRPVYAKNLKLNKGVDNVILFQFYNQDQKPVDVSDSVLVFRLIDQTGQSLLLTQPLEPVNAARGKMRLIVKAADLTDIPPHISSYSITRVRDEGEFYGDSTITGVDFVEPVFVDDHAGARGVVDVVDSVFPVYIPSAEVTIPDQFNPGDEVYSSAVTKDTDGVLTFQLFFDQYEGTVTAEGSVGPYGTWIPALEAPLSVVDTDTTLLLNVLGHFERVRLKFEPTTGTVNRILVR